MKWALGGVSLIAVIAITAAVSIALTKGSGGGGNGTPSASASPSTSASGTASNSDFASANDTGPVNIITEEPTCAAWGPINTTFTDVQDKTDWGSRDPATPSEAWSAEQRATYEKIGQAMKAAADQTVPLAKVTPHRVVRELYEQYIAYARAYSQAISEYKPADNNLANVAIGTSGAITFICAAISYNSAQARAPFVDSPKGNGGSVAAPTASNDVEKFLSQSDATCPEWGPLLTQFGTDTSAWLHLNPQKPASEWSADEKGVVDAVIPVMKKFADDIGKLGQSSPNPTVRDFSALAAQYWKAYAYALQTYTPADYYLSMVANRSTSITPDACKAIGA